MNIPGSENSRCKGPKVGTSLGSYGTAEQRIKIEAGKITDYWKGRWEPPHVGLGLFF